MFSIDTINTLRPPPIPSALHRLFLFSVKVQGDTDKLTILLLLSPVVLQEVAIFHPKAEFEGHSGQSHLQ